MPTRQDLDRLTEEAARLVFPRFDPTIAWRLGVLLHDAAAARGHAVAIDITVNGRQLFFSALPGSSANNLQWIRRKRAVAEMFEVSSLYKTWEAEVLGRPFNARYALPEADYAASGGAVPIAVAGVGVIGTATVSGLAMVDDHALIVECIDRLIAELSA
jgi:uncharacterized protein (UPF0303 family)